MYILIILTYVYCLFIFLFYSVYVDFFLKKEYLMFYKKIICSVLMIFFLVDKLITNL